MNLEIVLDKLDQEYLDSLCVRTGKNQQDVIKLALAMLHQQLCADAKQAPAPQMMPGPVYIYPVVTLPPPPPPPIKVEPSWLQPMTFCDQQTTIMMGNPDRTVGGMPISLGNVFTAVYPGASEEQGD
jgi:hypothetical protein